MSGSNKHIPALDGVRGLAMLLVLVCHFVPQVKPTGFVSGQVYRLGISAWVGVDLFFCLSGFLITRILLTAKGQPGYLSTFYIRRSVRIFPLYFLSLAIAFLLIPSLASIHDPVYQWLIDEQAWFWTYSINLRPVFSGFHDIYSHQVNLSRFWSLCVEEHFYLVWPFVVLALGRRALAVACVLGCCVAFGFRLMYVRYGGPIDIPYSVTFCRVDPILCGALVALASMSGRSFRSVAIPLAVVSALALAGMALMFRGFRLNDSTVTIGLSLLAVFFGSCLYLVVDRPQSIACRMLEAGWLVWIGQYSYGIYVWHKFFLSQLESSRDSLVSQFNNYWLAMPVFFVVACGQGFLFAWLSWHLWEKHWLKLKRFTEPPSRRTSQIAPFPPAPQPQR